MIGTAHLGTYILSFINAANDFEYLFDMIKSIGRQQAITLDQYGVILNLLWPSMAWCYWHGSVILPQPW